MELSYSINTKKVYLVNLRSLETFVEIAEQGSFIRTAENLNMTLSTVSMQMKVLEDELAVQLFDRSFRPPKLTPIGRKVAREAVSVLKASGQLFEACHPSDELTGDFHIGFVLTSSIRLLPKFLVKSQKEAPSATFHVETGLSDDLANRVVSGTLDAAIVTGGNLPAAIDTRMLTREEMIYCLPPKASSWSIERCMNEMPFIHFMPQTGIGRLIAQHLEDEGFSPNRVIVLDSVEAVAECVGAGVGFSILPEPDIRRSAGENISLRSLLETPVMRELVLAYQKRGALAAKVDVLASLFYD